MQPRCKACQREMSNDDPRTSHGYCPPCFEQISDQERKIIPGFCPHCGYHAWTGEHLLCWLRCS